MIKHIFGRKKGPPAPPKPDYSGPSPVCSDDHEDYSYEDPEKWANTDLTSRFSTISSTSSTATDSQSVNVEDSTNTGGKVYTLSGTDCWVEEQPRSGSPASDEGIICGSPVVTDDYSDPVDAKLGDIPTSPSSTERYLYTEPYDEEQDEVLEMYDEPYESIEPGSDDVITEQEAAEQQLADMDRLRMSAPPDDRPLEEYDEPWEWRNKLIQQRMQQTQAGEPTQGQGHGQNKGHGEEEVQIPGEDRVLVIEDDVQSDSSEEDIKTLPGYVNVGIRENQLTKDNEHLYINIHGKPNRDKITEDDLVIPEQNEFSAHFQDSVRMSSTPPVGDEPGNYEDPWDLGQKQEELENKIRQAQKGKRTSSTTESLAAAPPGMAIPKSVERSKPSGNKSEDRKSKPVPPVRHSQVEGVPSKSFVYHQQDDTFSSSPRLSKDVTQKPEIKMRKNPGRNSPDTGLEHSQSKFSSKADDFRPQEEYEAPWDLRAKKLHMSTGSFDHHILNEPTPPQRPESTPGKQDNVTPYKSRADPKCGSSRKKEKPTPFNLGCQAQNALGERVDPGIPLPQQSWYHGAITRGDAEALLRVHKEGSYLVRQSESCKTDFSLSLKGAAGFIHMKVLYRDNRYILGQASQPFDTIPMMIHHYTINKLNIKGADHMLLLHPIVYEML